MKKTITITGANGFVGTNLQIYFKNTSEIQTLSLRYVFNQQLTINTDVIIHLAGKAHDLKKVSNSNEYYEANSELTKQLFDAFLISNAKDFIFMSTVKSIADKVINNLTEVSESNPQTHYGKSKRLAEKYILSQQLPPGKRVFILRPSMIHGPGNKGNLKFLYLLVKKGLPWPLGAFKNKRSFCSIDNVCYVIHQLLVREEIPSGIYNLADDESLSTNELIQLIAKTTNKKVRIINVPMKLIKAIARIGDVFRFPLNSERLEKLTENFVVSNSKIKAALKIERLPVSAKEGLIKTINSFI